MKRLAQSFTALFFSACLLRVVFAVFYPSKFGDDDGSQINYALNLLQGHGYVVYRDAFPGVPFRAWLPPLFPVMVAGYMKFVSSNLFGLRMLFCAFGGLTCSFTAVLGRRLMGPRGVTAGWLLAVYPGHLFWSTRLLSESTVMLCSVIAIWCVFKAHERHVFFRCFTAGFLLALCALGRGEFLLVPAVVGLWLICYPKGWPVARGVTGLCLGALLALSPWIIRNFFVLHRLQVSATNYGENFYTGHSANYNFGGIQAPTPPIIIQEAAEGHLDEIQMARRFMQLSMEFIRAHPYLTALTVPLNFLVFWRPFLTPGYIPWKQNLLYTVSAFPLLVFFLAGIKHYFQLAEKTEWTLILWIILYKTLIHLPFYEVIRFREVISPFIVLVATLGFFAWRDYHRNACESN